MGIHFIKDSRGRKLEAFIKSNGVLRDIPYTVRSAGGLDLVRAAGILKDLEHSHKKAKP